MIGQARSLVDGISNYRVFIAILRADIACEYRTGGHSDTEVHEW